MANDYGWLLFFLTAISIVVIVAFFYLCDNVARIRRVLEKADDEKEKVNNPDLKKEEETINAVVTVLNEQKKSKL